MKRQGEGGRSRFLPAGLVPVLCLALSLAPVSGGFAEGIDDFTGPGIDTSKAAPGKIKRQKRKKPAPAPSAGAAESSPDAPAQRDAEAPPDAGPPLPVAEAVQRGHDALVHNDFAEALRWYKEAANQGDTDSQYMVGWIYFNGEGKVPRDLPQARSWIDRAAAGGNKDAQAWLERFVGVKAQADHPPPGPADSNPAGNPASSGSSAGEAPPPPTAPARETVASLDGSATSPLSYSAASQQYNYAFGLLRQGDYQGAEQGFLQFLKSYPNDLLAGNAQYWLGETYYVRQDYVNAAAAFDNGRKKYPHSNKGADNLIKLGMTLGNLGRNAEACQAFSLFGDAYPKAPPELKERVILQRKALGCYTESE